MVDTDVKRNKVLKAFWYLECLVGVAAVAVLEQDFLGIISQ